MAMSGAFFLTSTVTLEVLFDVAPLRISLKQEALSCTLTVYGYSVYWRKIM